MEHPRPVDSREVDPWWKIALALLAFILRWPFQAGPQIWRYWRYQRVADKAQGWRGRLTDDGLEVWRENEAPKRIGWEQLQHARWVERIEISMASGEEAMWVMELPGTDVALGPNAGLLWPLYQALGERLGRDPTLLDGGRSSGGVALAMIWTVIIALVLWGSRSQCHMD